MPTERPPWLRVKWKNGRLEEFVLGPAFGRTVAVILTIVFLAALNSLGLSPHDALDLLKALVPLGR